MARPQKEGLDYFPHDVYASSDEKIEPLLLLYGSKGYAFYFLHLEYIYRNSDLEFDISDAETREVICQKLRISDEEYNQILSTSLKKNCFDKKHYDETQKLTSEGVKKRANVVIEKRKKMRETYENRNVQVSASETKEETTSESTQSKVKESKVKKNIYTEDFEKFWSMYPRSQAKKDTFTSWKKLLKNGITVEQIMTATENYIQDSKESNRSTEYMYASNNFLGNKGYYESFLEKKKQVQSPSPQNIIRAPEEFRRYA